MNLFEMTQYFILYWLNKLWLDRKNNDDLLHAKMSPETYLDFWESRSASSFDVFGALDFTDLEVLDVGSGLGANLTYLLDLGAKGVMAIDIGLSQISQSRSMFLSLKPELIPRITFVNADASQLPFEEGAFDVVISADTFEHIRIDKVVDALNECSRVIKSGGYLYLYFPPFYAPWGAHMINWIKVPWCQVFFKESVILRVARRLEAEGTALNCRLPTQTRLDLKDGTSIPFVNHLKVSEFNKFLEAVPSLEVVKIVFCPPNWRSKHWTSKIMQPLTSISVLKEILTAKAVYVLKRV
jgi:ubiquinone/menaquinone biosynthesis C-methylase UbiE